MSTLTDLVEVPASVLEVLGARLSERRIAVEKEVLKYGEAPAGIKEVFELCRGFERAYVSYVNESPVASKIKEAFMGEKGLAGSVRKLPLEKLFELSTVKSICRTSDGYQPHLVSPEAGMRSLAQESLDQVSEPVHACVQQVYLLLLNAAREAAEKAGQFTEAALMGSMPMYVPDFKNVVMPAIVAALDEWKAEADKMAIMLVDMERSYLTAGFFRHTMYHRYQRIKQQQAMAKAAEQAAGKGGAGGGTGVAAKASSFFPAFGAKPDAAATPPPAPQPAPTTPSRPPAPGAPQPGGPAPDNASDTSDTPAVAEGSPGAKDGTPPVASGPSVSAASAGFNAGDFNDPNAFLAATFDKAASAESGLPSAWKWQKRFFIFSDTQRMLYYFKSSDDVQKQGQARGMVNLAECAVEDLDDRGNPRGNASAIPPNPADKSQLMIRIRHKDPRQSAIKDHNAIILRAESLETKMQWLARLRRAAEPRKPAAAAAGKDGSIAGGQQGAPAFSSFGGSLSNTTMDDLAWAKEAEPIVDTHLGEGSRAFRADNLRDSEGRLLPAPSTLLNPMRLSEKAKRLTGQAAFEARYDALMDQFGADMNIYARMVCDTVVTTVPKSIVHCIIRKSEKNLLERLFNVIHHLTPQQMEALLKEEDTIINRRREARNALEDIKTAMFQVHQAMERRMGTAPAERSDRIKLPVNCFAYSGSMEYLTKEHKAYFDKLFSSTHVPDAMKAWTVPPQVRALPPALAAATQKPAAGPQPAQQQGAPPVPQRPGPSGGAPPGQPMRPAPSAGSVTAQRAPPPAPGGPMGAPMVARRPPPPPGGK
uniref:Dynamin GTPase n=1 Tax=Chlamydomonas leiostraca TaxID=1034604 RepID=A0A7S0WQI3_9CHLO|mmetsp:Transcript_22795/g.57979  ORF Transcript_22795/g.57979 Transcript_22795/m.57979 type:complete len:819 (+) Transcript_22795:137-2593(+)|eukprot:CAMPEP_0202857372 /NCGR_PEP_ID=MMETSP1391-20130828/336_1 /ASSEMBLY_ACC=CAM_ASM_000867 /TAXON_ID=1034604 /ORGANISM="Chlamydomonas leiostraca, Strain SAG 11-49" /LENGTH=818 /DNA_ID=CAMNT_0049536161 /DNA_START=115 /DNA_END=2571 /DNA_ORIENTATION=-